MRYRDDLPLVLKDVSFSVPAGASLGVVGRTGAGKSSILQVLVMLHDNCLMFVCVFCVFYVLMDGTTLCL
jgi:ABC-type multidrug transport system fused ATPase/permease subunit